MHYPAPCHNSKKHRTSLECYGILILKWPGNYSEINSIENVWNMMKKEIGNQMSCENEMLKRVCEAWYSAAPNVLEGLYNSMPELNYMYGKHKPLVYEKNAKKCEILRSEITLQWTCTVAISAAVSNVSSDLLNDTAPHRHTHRHGDELGLSF